MMSKKNKSEKIDFSISLDNYIQGGYNDYLPIRANDNRSINLKKYIEFVERNVKAIQFRNYNTVPSKSFYLTDFDFNENQLPEN